MLQTQERINGIAKKLVLASKKVKIEPLLIKKTISELERLNAVSELLYLGECASDEVSKQAILALKHLKAVSELYFLGKHAPDEVRKQAVSALKRLDPAKYTQDKDKSGEQLVKEIKELVSQSD